MCVCTSTGSEILNGTEQDGTEQNGVGRNGKEKMEWFVNRVGIDMETASAGVLF